MYKGIYQMYRELIIYALSKSLSKLCSPEFSIRKKHKANQECNKSASDKTNLDKI